MAKLENLFDANGSIVYPKTLMQGITNKDGIDLQSIVNTLTNRTDEAGIDINTLKTRLDELSKSEGGIDQDDKELIDIRVGYDGIVRTNAGTSVREQIKQVRSNTTAVSYNPETEKITIVALPSPTSESIYSNDLGYKGIYYSNTYGIANDGSDCTDKFQSLIDTIWVSGGGAIVLSAGVYAVRGLNMRSNVSLIGQSSGSTLIKRLARYSTDTINSNKGILYFPEYSSNFTVQNLTINGRLGPDVEDNYANVFKFNYSPFETSGIYIEDTSTQTISGSKVYYTHQVASTTDSTQSKSGLIDNVNVVWCGAYGIYQGEGTEYVTTTNTYCAFNGVGIFIGSNFSKISDVICMHNCYEGIIMLSSRCQLTNIEVSFNGILTTAINRNSLFIARYDQSITDKFTNTCYGFTGYAYKTNMTNVRVDSNFCGGMNIVCTYAIITGLSIDGNGLVAGNTENSMMGSATYVNGIVTACNYVDSIGLRIQGSYFTIIAGIGSIFNNVNNIKFLKTGVDISNSDMFDIKYKADPNAFITEYTFSGHNGTGTMNNVIFGTLPNDSVVASDTK